MSQNTHRRRSEKGAQWDLRGLCVRHTLHLWAWPGSLSAPGPVMVGTW